MQLSMQLSYAGGFKESAGQVAELEKAGLDIVWVAEAYGFDGVSLMGYLGGTDRAGPDRRRHPADLHPHADAARHDRRRHRRPVRRPVRPRPRRVGPAGDRGLPRRALRQAARPHPRDHRHLPQGVGPRGAAHPRRADLPRCRCPRGRAPGLGKPLKIIAQPGAAADPDLRRGPRREERGAHRRDRRRLAAAVLPARRRPRRCSAPSLDAGAAKRSRRPRPARHLRRRHRVRRRARRGQGRARHARPPDGRPLHRRHGRQGPELLQRPRHPLRLRGRRRPRSRTSTSPARRTRPRPRSPTSSSSSPTCAAPRASSRSASPPSSEAGVTVLNVTPVAPDPAEARRAAQDLDGVTPKSPGSARLGPGPAGVGRVPGLRRDRRRTGGWHDDGPRRNRRAAPPRAATGSSMTLRGPGFRRVSSL